MVKFKPKTIYQQYFIFLNQYYVVIALEKILAISYFNVIRAGINRIKYMIQTLNYH